MPTTNSCCALRPVGNAWAQSQSACCEVADTVSWQEAQPEQVVAECGELLRSGVRAPEAGPGPGIWGAPGAGVGFTMPSRI